MYGRKDGEAGACVGHNSPCTASKHVHAPIANQPNGKG